MSAFRKRVFTRNNLPGVALDAARSLPTLVRALRRPETSAALREQIMLAVTSVNDCRYCAWGHTGLALAEGVDLDNLYDLLEGRLEKPAEEREARAILFARHYADSERSPLPEAREALAEHFSPEELDEIMAYIHAIYFANLTGNTVDALLSRLRGQPAEDSQLAIELLVTALGWPPLLGIWQASRRPGKPALESL
jgi:AhpD family alkylhydroperoxidase